MSTSLDYFTIKKADIQKVKNELLDLYTQRNTDVIAEEVLNGGSPYGTPHVWIVQDKYTKTIFGAGTVVIRKFYINGKIIKAGSVRDLIIDKSHRDFWPAFKL